MSYGESVLRFRGWATDEDGWNEDSFKSDPPQGEEYEFQVDPEALYTPITVDYGTSPVNEGAQWGVIGLAVVLAAGGLYLFIRGLQETKKKSHTQ